MYAEIFRFRFCDFLSPSDRMQFLSELFQVPEHIGSRVDDIYWYEMKYDGTVEFYSNSIDVTRAIEERLADAEERGVLKRLTLGIGSGLSFYGRIFFGLGGAALRSALALLLRKWK